MWKAKTFGNNLALNMFVALVRVEILKIKIFNSTQSFI